MPVKDIVFVHLHQVQVVLDYTLGNVVPAGVDQDATMSEPGGVQNLGTIDHILKRLLFKKVIYLFCKVLLKKSKKKH